MIPSGEDKSGKFEVIFQNHKNGIYNYALRVLGEKEAACDIVQEVFMRLFQRRDGDYREIGNIKGWLFITARNLCLNIKRGRKREISIERGIDIVANPAKAIDARIYFLEKAMQSIDLKFREALILREFEGFSYVEMAEILQLSVPAVKSLLFRSRVSLREAFDKFYSERK